MKSANADWTIGMIYLQTVGTYQITGSVIVDGILEDTIISGLRTYESGQPFMIPFTRLETTHNPAPTPSTLYLGITI